MSDQQQKTPTTIARFYKCALQVNTAKYVEHRGQKQTLSDGEYNQQLLTHALEAGVEVVGLADHRLVKGSETLRKLLTENNIVVFPGFEISSSEKIHFVCLFDENITYEELHQVFGEMGIGSQDSVRPCPSRLSAEQLIDIVNKKDGFIFAAHCTQEDGLLKRRMNHVWKHLGLRAAQIPGTLDDLKGVESDFYRKAFLNKLPDYRRKREMAAINASDVAYPEQIASDNTSCLIRMTRPCFASFKQAFLDPGSRVRLNADKPENYASAVEGIAFTGGYLDSVDISLSEHLNTVIGGRGTGKSTLLECIRFALDISPIGAEAQKQHQAIVDHNLGRGGMVELQVRSAKMGGRKFTVKRKYGDQPVVLDEQGNISPNRPVDLLPGLKLYGQNEINDINRDKNSRNQLIDRLLDHAPARFDELIALALSRLKENREAIVRALHQKADLEADVERLPRLEDQAQQYRDLGLDEKLKIVPSLEKEKQLSQRSTEELTRLKEATQTLHDSLPDTVFLSDTALAGMPHEELLRHQRIVLDDLSKTALQAIQTLQAACDKAGSELSLPQQQLSKAVQEEEQKLESAFKEIPASQGKTGRQIGAEYQALLQQIERIKPQKAAMASRQKHIDELYAARKKLLLELSEQQAARSSSLQTAIKRLNRKLKKKVTLALESEKDREPLLLYILSCKLEGIGQGRLAWVRDGNFSAANLADKIRRGENVLKTSGWSIPPSVTQGLCRLQESQLLLMEEVVLGDEREMFLNVAHDGQEDSFQKIDDLSTGQQCTAVLHLLLQDNDDPLILDQPEDNLDNAFIAERIVAELRRAKLTRQFLFATHNANIPILGDAEWMGVFSVDEGKGHILPNQQGAIDVPSIQLLAADILEGGESAFNHRREKYGYAK